MDDPCAPSLFVKIELQQQIAVNQKQTCKKSVIFSIEHIETKMHLFGKRDEVTRACSPLFRSARASSHGRPLSVRPLVRPQEKFGSHIYMHIYLMNHLKTHQTNLMAP